MTQRIDQATQQIAEVGGLLSERIDRTNQRINQNSDRVLEAGDRVNERIDQTNDRTFRVFWAGWGIAGGITVALLGVVATLLLRAIPT